MKDGIRASRTVRFGSFEIDREACELRRDGQRVPLQIQPFRVLEALVDRAGEVVTRTDLRALIWPSTIYVDFDHGLNSAMTRLRHALEDSSDAPRYIRTIPRIGYQFINAVEFDDVQPATTATSKPHAIGRRYAGAALMAVLVSGLLGAAAWLLGDTGREADLAHTSASSPAVGAEARVAYLRGLAFFEQRNKDAIARSIEQLTRATEADPDFAAAHAALAMAYVSAGGNNSLAKFISADDAFERALAASERALHLEPQLPKAHLALASVLNGLQPWSAGTDVAIEQAYKRALELGPDQADIHLFFGNFLSTRGRSGEAVTRFREAMELDPLSPSIHSRLGMELVSLGQVEAGLAHLHKTLELDPWQFNAQWRLGWAYVALDDLDAAERAFQTAEQISPGSVRSTAGLAFVAGKKGDGDRALALLSSVRREAEALNDPFDIAIVYVGLNDRDGSIEWLAKTARQSRTLHMQGPWGIAAPMYDWLRDEPGFAAIEAEIQAGNRNPSHGLEQ